MAEQKEKNASEQHKATTRMAQQNCNVSAEDILKIVATLLGASLVDGEEKRSNDATSLMEILPQDLRGFWNGDCMDDGEISSFPSLSLEHNHSRCDVASDDSWDCGTGARQTIESRVASLLSRPILVGNDDDDENTSLNDDNCTVVKDFVHVPDFMLQNFYASFCTLVDARLRVYINFLANHGLSLAEEQTETGIVGVGKKLDNLLNIARHLRADAAVTSFNVSSNASTKEKKENDALCVVMPLTMEAFIDISIPLKEPLTTTVHFCATGNIQGTFSKVTSASSSEVDSYMRLCALDVELNSDEMLSCMTKQAVGVVCMIADLTTAVGSIMTPDDVDAKSIGGTSDSNSANEGSNSKNSYKNGKKMHRAGGCVSMIQSVNGVPVVSPDLTALVAPIPDNCSDIPSLQLTGEDCSSLSPERCENIVDSVFGEIDERLLRKSKCPRSVAASTLPFAKKMKT